MSAEDRSTNDWLETFTGLQFHLPVPRVEDFDPLDIAVALSRQCRYNGHTKRWYSVAEHCCLMSDWVLRQPWGTYEDALTALHHDDAEAYIGDVARPAKQFMPDFKIMENYIESVAAEAFGFQYPFPSWLKKVDTHILVDERAQVMRQSGNKWFTDSLEPVKLRLWNVAGRFPYLMRLAWLRRHEELTARIEGTWQPTP